MLIMKFNKGEWSEIYTFLKIISNQNICWGDEKLNINDIYNQIDILTLENLKIMKN